MGDPAVVLAPQSIDLIVHLHGGGQTAHDVGCANIVNLCILVQFDGIAGSGKITHHIYSDSVTLHLLDEIVVHRNAAGALGTDFYDEYYCKASCYADIGEYEKACATYMEIAGLLRQNGFEEEAEMAESEVNEILKRANL